MDHKEDQGNYLIYATANEGSFLADIQNIAQMASFDPGVGLVRLYIVVSDVGRKKENSATQFASIANYLIDLCPWLELRAIIKKGNIGRDFSSVKVGIDEIKKEASNSDYILIRNRSSVGPLCKNWYVSYKNLFNSEPKIGLVGNSVNLAHHPSIQRNKLAPHVQTYVYFSSFKVLDFYRKGFPGITENDRLDVINFGEIELSRLIMDQGFIIKCLNWPDKKFGNNIPLDPLLPLNDIKKKLTGLPFLHRKGIKPIPRLLAYISMLLKKRKILKKLKEYNDKIGITESTLFYD